MNCKIYFEDTQQKLKIRLNPSTLSGFEIKGYADSDFAGDLDTRRSVSGYVLYFNGVIIAWRSRAQ